MGTKELFKIHQPRIIITSSNRPNERESWDKWEARLLHRKVLEQLPSHREEQTLVEWTMPDTSRGVPRRRRLRRQTEKRRRSLTGKESRT